MEIKAPQAVIREKARMELKGAVQLIQKNFGIEPDLLCDMLKGILADYEETKATQMTAFALQMAIDKQTEEKDDDHTEN